MINKSLIALAMGTFALGIAEFAMMGILTTVAASLGQTIPEAGDFISAYSSGVSFGAPFLLLLSRFPLRRILLALCFIIVGGNIMSAFATGHASLVLARFISGMPHGAFFGVASIVAIKVVPEGHKAGAVATMVAGMTVANVFGVPLATMLSNMFSWRITFIMVALCGLCAFAAVRLWVPEIPPLSRPGKGAFKKQFKFLKGIIPWLIYLGTFLGQGAIYCWYSYLEPIMLRVTGFTKGDMTWIMVMAGIGMVIGGILGGRMADRHPPALVSGFISLMMIPILALIYLYSSNVALSLCLTFIGAGALFGIGNPMQYLIVRYSPGGEMLGAAGIQVAFNVANAVAAWLGGVAIGNGMGITSPALVGIPLSVFAVIILFMLHWQMLRTARKELKKVTRK